jgi:hypothetical protein
MVTNIAERNRLIVAFGLYAGIVGVLLATVLSTTYIFWVGNYTAGDLPKLFLIVAAFAVLPAGGFGICCGLIAGTILVKLKRRRRSEFYIVRLGGLCGLLLGCTYPLVSYVAGWSPENSHNARLLELCLTALVGAITGILVSFLLKERLSRNSEI